MRKIIILSFLTFSVLLLFSQQSGITEKDLIKKAQSFYHDEIWQEALPLYAQLVSVYPNDPEYNFKFGVCSLMGDRTNNNRAIRYLNIAYTAMPENKELLYYLGLANYQNQEFASALQYFFKSLEFYGTVAPESKIINDHINSCQRGLELIHKNMLDEILVKTEFQYENFHRAYPANELEGSLIQKPAQFCTAKEKMNGERSYVYMTEPRTRVYYSGYVSEESNHRDIFVIALNDDGEWGEAIALSSQVNTEKDEAYPVLADEGNTLYFCSKGHGSMGGYDVYKSSLDKDSGEFGTPENMGVGINSPFDDIMFIPDNSGDGAYFSSNRENTDNNITVYQISLNNGMRMEQEMMANNEPSQDEISTSTLSNEAMNTEIQHTSAANSSIAAEEEQQYAVSIPENIAQEEAATAQPKSKEIAKKTDNTNINQQSDGLKIKWALVYEDDEVEEEPAIKKEATPIPSINPVTQVQMVKYVATQSMFVDMDESLEIHLEADLLKQVERVEYAAVDQQVSLPDEKLEIHLEVSPVEQVQMVKYAAAQVAYPEDEESLELIIEPDPVLQVEAIVWENNTNNLPEEEEQLEVLIEADPEIQVKDIVYEAAIGSFPADEELLEVNLETEITREVEPVAFTATSETELPVDENLEIILEPVLLKQVEMVESSNINKYNLQEEEELEISMEDQEIKGELHEDNLSSLMAAEHGIITMPENIPSFLGHEQRATDNQLIKTAINRPDALSYDELLYAASLSENPDAKLKIYYNTFIRLDRDWRAYYNASIAARNASNPEQAEVFLYQARLIYDEEFMGHMDAEFELK